MTDRTVSLLIAFILTVVGCREDVAKEQAPAPASRSAQVPRDLRPNLLSLANGAVVIHRTGELKLTASAIDMIDGERSTSWSSPPGSLQQTAVVELPVLTRLTEVGFSTGSLVQVQRAIKELRFEVSTDGESFTPLATVSATKTENRQLVKVSPTLARRLRLSMLSNLGGADLVDLPTAEARGADAEPFVRGAISGSWQINQFGASFAERGSRVVGTVSSTPTLQLDGGWSGRTLRFIWTRGPQYGLALLTVNRSGSHLNGVWWFEEALPIFRSEAWFGERRGKTATVNDSNVTETFLERFGKAPLYQLDFGDDNTLDPTANRATLDLIADLISKHKTRGLRFVAHEHRQASPEENQKRGQAQALALRRVLENRRIDLAGIEFVSVGNGQEKHPPTTMIERIMYSRLVVELTR